MSNKTVYIYTDGSCNNKTKSKGGYGIILKYMQHEKQYHFGQYYNTTSARMELRAVIHALRLITNKTFKVNLYCDNQYVVYSHAKFWLLSWEQKGFMFMKNADLLKQLLFEIRQFPQDYVHFHWVKGHNNHRENEICDRLAAAGSKLKTLIDDSVKMDTIDTQVVT